jgi:hypothetical protein
MRLPPAAVAVKQSAEVEVVAHRLKDIDVVVDEAAKRRAMS